MGFFDFLFKRNPTAEWRETIALPNVDIFRCLVNGKGFRASMADFSELGPAARWPGKNGSGSLWYPSKGLELDFEFDQFVGATIFLKPPSHREDPAARPFQGALLRSGAPVALPAGVSEAEIAAVLGRAKSRDDDEEETTLQYVFGNVVLELEISKPGGLEVINVFFEGEVSPR